MRRLLSPGLFLLALAGPALVYLGWVDYQHTRQLQHLLRQEGEARQEVAALGWDLQRLRALQEYLNSDEYVEGQARRVLGWVRPGEKGITVISPASSPASSREAPRGTRPGARWWEAFFGD